MTGLRFLAGAAFLSSVPCPH